MDSSQIGEFVGGNIHLFIVGALRNDFIMATKNSRGLFINFTLKAITVCELFESNTQIVRMF